MVWKLRSQSGWEQAGEIGRNAVEYCATEGESIQNCDQASNAIRGRKVDYNEEARKTDLADRDVRSDTQRQDQE